MDVNLTLSERAVIKQHLEQLTPQEKNDYDNYLQAPGITFDGVDLVPLGQTLHLKGWLSRAPVLMGDNVIWLSEQAWKLFSLEEWDRVEDEALESARGETWGSW